MSRVSFRALLTAPLLTAALVLSACGGDDAAENAASTWPAATTPADLAAATSPGGTTPAAEEAPDGAVATTPGEAQNAVFAVLAVVETCWAGAQDYTKCQSPEAIGNIGQNVVDSKRPKPGEVAVTSATRDTYKIIATSAEGNLYVMSKGKDGNVERRCKTDAGKACENATW